MNIKSVKYIKDGYFLVKYRQSDPVVQDVTAIEMTCPTSPAIKDCLLFLRKIKIEKIKDNGFDDTDFRDQSVYETKDLSRGKLDDMFSDGFGM